MFSRCNSTDKTFTKSEHKRSVRHFVYLYSENFVTSVQRCYHAFFQVLGIKAISTGNISSLPASMSKISTIFDKGVNAAKLP